MEEDKHDKAIRAFSKKYLSKIPEEAIAIDFTSKVMNKIEASTSVRDVFVFKPLISKKRALFIGMAILVLLMSVFNAERKAYFMLPEFDVSFMEKINFQPMFGGMPISSNTISLALLATVLLWAQLFYLKRYFEKQLEG